MSYQGNNDQRQQPRVSLELPATISIGTQLTINGQVKDLSLSSAFIKIKNMVYLNVNDEVGLVVQASPTDTTIIIEGTVRISRIVPGEGFAVYFVKVDDNSTKNIKKFLQKPS
jgi:hypothetical protein